MFGLDPVTLALVGAVFVAAQAVRGTLGFGDALVAVPLLTFLVPTQVAVAAVAALSVVIGVSLTVTNRANVDWRGAGSLLLGGVAGLPVGLWALQTQPAETLEFILGAALVAAGGHGLARSVGSRPWADWRSAPAFGLLGGILGGMLGTAGPPLVFWASGTGWSPGRIRGTLQGFFVPISALAVAGHAGTGLWTGPVAAAVLVGLPAVAIGTVVGNRISPLVSPERFRVALFVALLVLGAAMLIRGLFGSA